MKRILNFRKVVAFGLFFLIGIGLGLVWLYRSPFFWVAGILAVLCLFLLWSLCLRNESRRRAVLFLVLMILASSLGFSRLWCEQRSYRALPEAFSGQITARVISENSQGEIVLDSVRADGQAVPGKLLFYRAETQIDDSNWKLVEGDRVSFRGTISRVKIDGQNLRVSGYIRGIRYTAYPEGLTKQSGQAPVFAAVRRYLKDRLGIALKGESYQVGIALLIGESGEMDDLTYNSFEKLGILHIFAVSGLHFSVLFFFLLALFRKLKVSWLAYAIVFAILLFYAGVCEFSPSVVRALVMNTVLLGGTILFRKYDMLSSLFLSAVLIGLIQPYQIASAGFLLSFSGVLSIILLMPLFQRLFRFLPEKLCAVVSVSFAAQIGLVPVVSYFFGRFYTLAVFLNILISPIVWAAFLLLFLFSVIVLPFPALYFLFSLPRVLLEAMLWIVEIAAKGPASLIFRVGLDGIFLGFALMLTCSRFVNLRVVGKLVGCLSLCVLFLAAQGIGYGIKSGDRAAFSEFGVLIKRDGRYFFADSGGGKAEELAEWLRNRRLTIDCYVSLDSGRLLTRLDAVTKETKVRTVRLADRFSGEEAAALVYAERHFGVDGRLTEVGAWNDASGLRFAFLSEGTLCLDTGGTDGEGLRIGMFLSASAESAVRAFQKNSIYYTYACGDYPGVRVFCALCDGRHSDAIGHGSLLFRLKSDIITPTLF